MFMVWLLLLAIGLPVGYALLFSPLFYYVISGNWSTLYYTGAATIDALNSFSLLAVPFFILTGILMNSSGITDRIFNFAKAMVGHYTGGLAYVNILASLLFSGMSGSALADAGGLGQLEIKSMRDEGYADDFCGGVTAASCIIGPLVPPSIPLVIYGVVANESISKLFLAGFIPGILTACVLMITSHFIAKKRGYHGSEKATGKEKIETFKKSFFALLTPVIIIGGIFSGKFTPTEASVIATLYSLILGFFVYRELTIPKLFENLIDAVKVTGVTSLMIIGVGLFGQVIAREQTAIHVANFFVSVADSKIMILVMINITLLFLGMFVDALPLQILVVPIFVPVVQSFGIDTVYFGIMVIFNLMIGILTPPMGTALFVVSKVGEMPSSTVIKGILPFMIPLLTMLALLTLFPEIALFLPNLLG